MLTNHDITWVDVVIANKYSNAILFGYNVKNKPNIQENPSVGVNTNSAFRSFLERIFWILRKSQAEISLRNCINCKSSFFWWRHHKTIKMTYFTWKPFVLRITIKRVLAKLFHFCFQRPSIHHYEHFVDDVITNKWKLLILLENRLFLELRLKEF